jgi:FKBP-type peptidyl-prolyl cis-trans isomerase SlyD
MKPQIISFQCTIKNKSGIPLMSSVNRNVLNKIDSDNTTLNGLALALQGLKKGETRVISLSAEKAYGLYDPKKIIFHSKDKVPKTVKVGEFITIVDRSHKHRLYRVMNVQKEMITLDGNHPLAGQDLIFEISTLDVRDASDQEVNASLNLMSAQVLH